MGWRAVKNGTPLARAAAAGFEVLVTTDAGIEHQHNPADLPTAVVILHAASNDLSDLLPLVPGLLAVLNTRPARVVRHVLAAT